jgi:ABC-type sugar transport system substrate-binding protein
MSTKPASTTHRGLIAALAMLASVTVAMSTLASAQESRRTAAAEDPGFFASIGRWFDQQSDNFNAYFRGTREHVEKFGQQAGVAARRTVDTAKDAADAIARVPNTRIVIGHEKCIIAPNGAPDCIAAANRICMEKGFFTGKSVDMTTAEVCPAHVYLAGRNSGPECRTETFVSRAICQ